MRRNQDFVFRAKRTRPFKSAGLGVSSVDCWQPRCAASAVVMLDTPCSEVVWWVLATHSIRRFPLHFPSCASQCAITFQLDSTCVRPASDMSVLENIEAVASTRNRTKIPRSSSQWPNHQFQCATVPLGFVGSLTALKLCFSNFVRPRPGKFFFHKMRVRSQHIYSQTPFHFFKFIH